MNEPIHNTLGDIASFLRKHELPFALIGGLAVGVRGEPRFTADIDVVVGIDSERGLQLLDELPESPFRPLFADAAEVVETALLLPLRHRHTGIKVDLALGMTGFEQQAIRRATNALLGGREVPVVSAEDLILMKLLAGRPRDNDDLRRIVQRQGDLLDKKYLRETARGMEEVTDQELVTPLEKLLQDEIGKGKVES